MKALKKILLIEDNKVALDMLNYSAYLLKHDVYSSIGEMDYDEIKMLLPDLVIIDYWLNVWGGDICSKIKSNPATNSTPVIMLSSCQEIKKISKENCANAYLTLPLNAFDLDNAINRFV